MSGAEFSPLALNILRLLAPVRPAWVLSGRSALWKLSPDREPIADLELAWFGVWHLGSLSGDVRGRLGEAGLDVTTIRSGFASCALVAEEHGQTCTLSLRAEPGPFLEAPWRAVLKEISLEVESPRDVFVDRLCDLLDRPDLRDFADVCRLLKSGAVDLKRALKDAPRKRQGFSSLLLAWGLQNFRIPEKGMDGEEVGPLRDFQSRLVQQILAISFPDSLVS